ncbi:MAG: bifunctional UDP-N-acetylmuramoyl-tripeptide:D-alanyl-D-alanine ligase/alanine racemase [Bacteroidales bacterium]|nr:bifunctional UDP-N-acetylmuramoyl-tripeptide:D-alanyl-D-alanine ligase/alanine racemase [Bacteroidales bacterium]
MNTIEEISKMIHGRLIQFVNNNLVSELLIDSRLLLFPSKTIFFALTTPRNDGHLYIQELYDQNVRNFVITQSDFPIKNFPKGNFCFVENGVDALQQLAIEHRKTLKGKIVGITGSNGKTIVKEWSKQLLEPYFRITASPKSYNSQIGVPLSLWQASADDDLCFFEAGISQPDEMQRLEKMIQPTIGIFTNIGSAHSENFETLTQKIQEKLQLFEHVKTLIYCSDQVVLSQEIQKFAQHRNIQLISWGHQSDSFLKMEQETISLNSTHLRCTYQQKQFDINIPFADQASIENIMHCLTLAIYLQLPVENLLPSLQKLKSVALRLEMHQGNHDCIIINDSYNLDMDSLRMALDFLQQQAIDHQKTLILSDIPQSGKKSDDLYQTVSDLIKEKKITRFIGIGNELMQHRQLFPEGSLFFENTPQLPEKIAQIPFHSEAILLKGSRRFQFENINNVLQKQTHETVLEINIGSLIHNLNYYRLLAKPAKMMAMVKAFAYGSGSTEIANILQHQNIDYLCVAYIDEGIELRKSGIQLPIMIMNPEASGFEDILKYRLEPEIYNFRTLQLLEELIQHQLFYCDQVIHFHLKLDTGMHRLGFEEHDLDRLIEKLLQLRNCRLQSIFSHFACSDDSACDNFTERQLTRFEQMSQKIAQALPYPVLRHISNSAAISRLPQARFDMVRLGIGLYGVASNEDEQQHLEVVNSLFSVISQIKTIAKGEYVGYSQGFLATTERRIATIPIGYADGLHRALKNRGKVLINGQRCPIVGNICMDMCMVDVTDINANEGDRVEIFGKNNPIAVLAQEAGTIPYELFTGISPRVKRIYIQE